MGQVLAVDFDGVINGYQSGWNKNDPLDLPDPVVPGTFEFLTQAVQHFEVYIHTSRARYPGAGDAIRRYLVKHYVSGGHGNIQSAHALVARLRITAEKPPAHVSIDDRAIQFNGVYPSLDEIFAFKPWNKRGTLITEADRNGA